MSGFIVLAAIGAEALLTDKKWVKKYFIRPHDFFYRHYQRLCQHITLKREIIANKTGVAFFYLLLVTLLPLVFSYGVDWADNKFYAVKIIEFLLLTRCLYFFEDIVVIKNFSTAAAQKNLKTAQNIIQQTGWPQKIMNQEYGLMESVLENGLHRFIDGLIAPVLLYAVGGIMALLLYVSWQAAAAVRVGGWLALPGQVHSAQKHRLAINRYMNIFYQPFRAFIALVAMGFIVFASIGMPRLKIQKAVRQWARNIKEKGWQDSKGWSWLLFSTLLHFRPVIEVKSNLPTQHIPQASAHIPPLANLDHVRDMMLLLLITAICFFAAIFVLLMGTEPLAGFKELGIAIQETKNLLFH
ncbi:MAG: hypothetical protein ACOYK8_08715 [Alphaproteobacteria bacterium]